MSQPPTRAMYRGRIEGSRLVYESLQEGLPRIRLTWDLVDATHATWRNEFALDGQTWRDVAHAFVVVGEPAIRGAP